MADFGAIRALAFDLDGTLVDSAPGLAAAIDMALEETGLPQAGEERVGTWIGKAGRAKEGRSGGRRVNKPTPFVAPLLASLGIGDYFSLVIGGDDVTEKKPHPAPLYLVLGKLGLRAHELLFVGDSRNDIQAAQGAGCPSVGFTYGYNYGESIALSHPDRVLERFADLLPALGLSSLENQEI